MRSVIDQAVDEEVARTVRLNGLGDDALEVVGAVKGRPGMGTGIAIGLGLAAVGALAWAFFPVQVLSYDEKVALADAGVIVLPPGHTVCPVSTVPLTWSPDIKSIVGWDRWVLLTKAGWRFYVPDTATSTPSKPVPPKQGRP